MTSGTKIVICHNCGGFGYTQGPRVSVCRDGDGTLSAAGGLEVTRSDNLVREMLVYECGACSGAGYLTI